MPPTPEQITRRRIALQRALTWLGTVAVVYLTAAPGVPLGALGLAAAIGWTGAIIAYKPDGD